MLLKTTIMQYILCILALCNVLVFVQDKNSQLDYRLVLILKKCLKMCLLRDLIFSVSGKSEKIAFLNA